MADDHSKVGTFVKGHQASVGHRKGGGRAKGTPNATSGEIRRAIIGAMASIGSENGRGGLQGYIARVLRKDFSMTLGMLQLCCPRPLDVHVAQTTNINLNFESSDSIKAELLKSGVPESLLDLVAVQEDYVGDDEPIEAELIPLPPK